jgi:uncharacterized protein YqhQ
VLPLRVLERILDALRRCRHGGPFDEFTIEVNPEDIVEKGQEYVSGLLKLGVTRVRMGVQSFNDGILKFMNRRHNADAARKAYEMLGIEEEEPTKFEKWLDKHFGKSLVNVATAIGTILGLVLAVFLFMFLPTVTSTAIFGEVQEQWGMRILKSVFSGVFRIAIFLAYIGLVALIPDIKRTFQYHGAEHKSVFCHEKYLELNVENVKAQSRFHPRCGTSFLVVMMILGIFINLFFVNTPVIIQTCLKLVTLPLVVALGYEFIRFAGRHDNIFTRILSAPGLWIQRITTREPDEQQLNVALIALKGVLE